MGSRTTLNLIIAIMGFTVTTGCATTPAHHIATAYSETVTVDFSSDRGPATYRASGFLFGMTSSRPVDALVLPLKPKLFRTNDTGNRGGPSGYWDIYNRATAMGAKIHFLLDYAVDTWAEMGPWLDWVRSNVNQVRASGQAAEWEIWNEPDCIDFWTGTQAQFFELWRQGFLAIRAIDPNAVIVGLSTCHFNPAYLETFLLYAKSNNVLPNVLNWHGMDDPATIPADVQAMRSFMAANGINIQKISINEMIFWTQTHNPGAVVRHLAGVERSGIDCAAHTVWAEADGSWPHDTLSGLLTTDGTQPRSGWWVYKGYADVTGRLVDVAPSATVDGVAGQDDAQRAAAMLIGRSGGTGDVAVSFAHVSSLPYMNTGTVHVVAQRIPNVGDAAMPSPTPAFTADYPIVNGAVTVILPNMGASEAYTLRLTPGSGGGGGGTTGLPLDLQGFVLPEEATVNLNSPSGPGGSTAAVLTMSITDPDAPNEGALYVNGNGPVALFGSQEIAANDGRTVFGDLAIGDVRGVLTSVDIIRSPDPPAVGVTGGS